MIASRPISYRAHYQTANHIVLVQSFALLIFFFDGRHLATDFPELKLELGLQLGKSWYRITFVVANVHRGASP